MYGFDDELPAGFQDADIELREAEALAEDLYLERAREESEQPEPVLIDHAL